jgi:hypothetical protein
MNEIPVLTQLGDALQEAIVRRRAAGGQPPEPVSSRPRHHRRRLRWIGLGAAAAAAAVVVVAVQLASVGPAPVRERVGGGSTAVAAPAFRGLAAAAAAQEAPPEDARYYYRRWWEGDPGLGRSGGPNASSQLNEVWVSVDRDGERVVRTRAVSPWSRFAVPGQPVMSQDRTYTVPSPAPDHPYDDKHPFGILPDMQQESESASAMVTATLPDVVFDATTPVASLPTDPAALDRRISDRARLYARHDRVPGDREAYYQSWRWGLLMEVLESPAASPALRSTAFQVAARLPGATLLATDARDALGRHGVKLQARISAPGNPETRAPTTMLFDRDSGRLLSLEAPNGETYADEEAYKRGVGTPTMVLKLFLAEGAVGSTTQTIGS